jgi:hypothetical protein
MKGIHRVVCLAIAGVLLFGLSTAQAFPSLTIRDVSGSGGTIVIQDGSTIPGLEDQNDEAGIVSWIGTIGNWTVSTEVGMSKPASGGTVWAPYMDLNFGDQTKGIGSSAAGTIEITFSDTGYIVANGVLEAYIQGNRTPGKRGWVEYQTLINGNEITDSDVINNNFFSSDVFNDVIIGRSDVLSQVLTIHHNSAAVTTGDAGLLVTAVPDGGVTAMLLGFVFVCMGSIKRNFKS